MQCAHPPAGCGAAVKKCIDPQLDIPETVLPGGYADSLCLADLEWSEIFSDPLLKDLIEKTLKTTGTCLRQPPGSANSSVSTG